MHRRQHETTPNTTDLSQAPQLETETTPRQPYDRLTLPTLDAGSAPNPAAQAAALKQASGGRLSRAGNSLLQLQRQYGNRYVQHVVAQARRGEATSPEESTQLLGDVGAAKNRTGMPNPLKAGLEQLSSMDLSALRVHYNASKPAQLNALAYTQGQDIHIGPGQEKHLSHEGWHAVQQMQGRVKPTIRAKGVAINDDAGLEREADVMGAKALRIARADQVATGPAQPRTTPLQPGAGPPLTVQCVRDPLTTKEVLAALNNISFIKGKLKMELHGSRMNTRVADMLRGWKEHFAKRTDEDVDIRDAMMLSMALGGVARIISEELNDVSVQPVVAQKLFELYRTNVGNKIKAQQRKLSGAKRTKVLGLTEALVADDPVTRFMHREISLSVAAHQINTMATNAQQHDASITPIRMFKLLEQQFQVKMASYHKDQLHADVGTERFSPRESPGEYSEYFFKRMFGANAFATGDQLQWTATAPNTAERLEFSQKALHRLNDLYNTVTRSPAQPAVLPRAGVTAGQERHLQSIETAEAARGMAGIKAQFVNLFQTRYFVTASAADTLYNDVVNHLNTAKLTITVKAQDWFGGIAPPNPNFTPSAANVAQTPIATAFGRPSAPGHVTHLPTWDDTGLPAGEQRGQKYLRFRAWKDELMSGLNQLAATERAVFGALNVNWDMTRGSDSAQMHGENYYGDLHFVLDRNKVHNRMIYTATDHGQHRRNPLLALHDFTFGGRGITWLQKTKKLAMLDNIVNAVTARKPLYGLPLLFEVQIFGGVNVRNDVAEVHLGNAVTPALKTAVDNFYTGTGVTVVQAGAAPNDAIQTVGDVDEMLMIALVASTHLAGTEKQNINVVTAAAAALSPQQRLLMKNVMTVADYVTKTANAGRGVLTTPDLANLDAAVAKITGPANHMNTSQQFTNADKAAIFSRILAARAALARAHAVAP